MTSSLALALLFVPSALAFILPNHGVFVKMKETPQHIQFLPDQRHENVLCRKCESLMASMQVLMANGTDYSVIEDKMVDVCLDIGNTSAVFCEGFIALEGPHLYSVLEQNPNLEPQDMCGELLTHFGCVSSDPSRNWTVDISGQEPVFSPPPQPENGSPIMRVLHLADPHVDPLYAPGSNAACQEPLCCRNTSGPVLHDEDAAWYWGDYRKCGLPYWTFEDMLSHIASTEPTFDYIIWTGDNVPHNVWSTSENYNVAVINQTGDMIRTFFPSTPIFPSVGNHDTSPLDQFPAANQAPPDLDNDWLYEELLRQWRSMIPNVTPDVEGTIRRGGYYSVLFRPGFRIISLNSMWGYTNNVWLFGNSVDPDSQLAWLESELNKAEAAGELVHILQHIPPGTLSSERTWSREFNRIVRRYKNTIRGQFSGHTHKDEFEVVFDQADVPASVVYICQSIATWSDLNPGYRIYTIDGVYNTTTLAVLDFDNYFLNLTEAQTSGTPKWTFTYSAKSMYNMSDLSPSSWYNFAQRASSDRDLFDLYYGNYIKQSPMEVEEGCNEICYRHRLCDMVTSDRNEKDPCYRILKSYRRKRME